MTFGKSTVTEQAIARAIGVVENLQGTEPLVATDEIAHRERTLTLLRAARSAERSRIKALRVRVARARRKDDK